MAISHQWLMRLLLGFYTLIMTAFLIFISEWIIGLLYPEIQVQATSKNIIQSNRYFSSAGLLPNSTGLTNGNTITVDSFGSRKTAHIFDSSLPTDLYFGDSVTMGLGVEDDSTFSAIVQSQFPDRNILNFGLVGYDIDDYKNLTTHFISLKDSLSINKVILFWCLNDIYDSSIDQFSPSKPVTNELLNQTISIIRSNSKLYAFLKANFVDRPKSYFQFDVRFYSNENYRYHEILKELLSIRDRFQAAGIQFQIFLLPYEFQIRSNNLFPQVEMSNTLNEQGLLAKIIVRNFINSSFSSGQLYLYGDGIHFSNSGHRLVADILLQEMRNYKK